MSNTISIDGILELLKEDSAVAWETLGRLKKGGEFPRLILPSLREILRYYFETGITPECLYDPSIDKYPELPILLDKLSDELRSLESSDVCYLYSIALKSEPKLYFANVIKKLLSRNLYEIKSELQVLAGYLSTVDPSIVVESRALNNTYKKLGVGNYVTFSEFLTKHLPLLCQNAEPEVNKLLGKLKVQFNPNKILPNTPLNKDFISELAKIYKFRWELIKGTPVDYTRVQESSSTSAPWIFVARLLCGVKDLIDDNYYRFLMPTINHDVDEVTKEPLVNYPLTHFVLSDDASLLILLDSSAEYHRVDKERIVFCNRSVFPPRPFTNNEFERIKYSAKRFREYSKVDDRNIPVLRSTVYLVLELLISSLRKSISDADLEAAYLGFCEKLDLLDQDELERLHGQQISWDGSRYSFYHILSTIALGDFKEGCTTEWGKYLLKWVIDYIPEVELPPEILDIARVRDMRIQSKKYRVSDEVCLSSDEKMRRFELLELSFTKFPFKTRTFELTQKCNNDYAAMMSKVLNRDILLLLKDIIQNKKIDDPYSKIISNIVLPLQVSNMMSHLPNDLRNYLEWIRSEYFYSSTFPKQLFLALQTLPAHVARPSVQLLLDKIIHRLLNHDDATQAISVQLDFMSFMKALSESKNMEDGQLHKIILKQIKTIKYLIPSVNLELEFFRSLYDYLSVKRQEHSRDSGRHLNFFSPSSEKRKKKSISDLSELDLSNIGSVNGVFDLLERTRVEMSSGRRGRSDSLPTFVDLLDRYQRGDFVTASPHSSKAIG